MRDFIDPHRPWLGRREVPGPGQPVPPSPVHRGRPPAPRTSPVPTGIQTVWCERLPGYVLSYRPYTEAGEDLPEVIVGRLEGAALEAEKERIRGLRWRSMSCDPIYRLPDGREVSSRELPVGAIYDAESYHDWPAMCGRDGLSLYCVLPFNHHWHIDGPCSNCNKQGIPHKCWRRDGDPRGGKLDVPAGSDPHLDGHVGAGSIEYGRPGEPGYWHGHLRHGRLVSC